MTHIVNIIPVEHQHIRIFVVNMLMFVLDRSTAVPQLHKAARMTHGLFSLFWIAVNLFGIKGFIEKLWTGHDTLCVFFVKLRAVQQAVNTTYHHMVNVSSNSYLFTYSVNMEHSFGTGMVVVHSLFIYCISQSFSCENTPAGSSVNSVGLSLPVTPFTLHIWFISDCKMLIRAAFSAFRLDLFLLRLERNQSSSLK